MVSSISSGSSDYLAYLLEKYASSSSTSTTSETTTNSSSSTSGSTSTNDMFSKLTTELGGDGKTITKDELSNYIKKVESDTTGTYDKGSLGFLNQLSDNWDSISGGSDSITESQLKAGSSYLKPPTSGSYSGATDLFSALSDAMDTDGDGISLNDLTSYLTKLTSSDSDEDSSTTSDSTSSSSNSTASTTSSSSSSGKKSEIELLTEMIDDFNTFSGGSDTITSSSFYSALKQPQDTSTISAEQLVSPISLQV